MFATIYVPNFYLQAALRHQGLSPTAPVGLIEEREKKPTIIQLNAAAKALGIHQGMTPSQGLARSLALVIKARSPAQEKSMQEIVMQQAFTLSPYVEATGPGICTVEFTHDAAWQRHSGDDRKDKLSRVIEQLAKCEIVAQIGLSPTPDTSFLAAHLARPVLQINDPKEFLAPLPIDTLAISLA